MKLELSLGEALAVQLRREASARRLSPEQTAQDLLVRALAGIAEEQEWGRLNRRRGELIKQSREAGLTAEEGQELDQLQAAVDQRLAPTDRQLLDMANRLLRLAEGLPDATG